MFPPNLKLAWLQVDDCSCLFSIISRNPAGNTLHFSLSIYGDNRSRDACSRNKDVTADNTDGISEHVLQYDSDWLRTSTCPCRGISETNSFHESPVSGTAFSASNCSCEPWILQIRCSLIGIRSLVLKTFQYSSRGRCSGSISATQFNMRRNDLEIRWVSIADSVRSAMMSLWRRVKFMISRCLSSLDLVI